MKPFVWQEGMSLEEAKNGAYWERNMLAVYFGCYANKAFRSYLDRNPELKETFGDKVPCGWYIHGEWEGWSRVISLFDGQYTFHIPDDFDLGNKLPQIEPNWDGHTTYKKWEGMMSKLGMTITEED
jgi:hypothetical protein